ncbi:FAD-dependent oxidoreductase [soil metagenome]
MTERLVVIGGDAAGMSAAATAKRRARDDLEVVVLERTGWTSYSACGIPYWASGAVDGPEGLVARSPEAHRERGIDVRIGAEATAIDTGGRTVTVRPVDDGSEQTISYDRLLVATGAEPVRPDVPGADAPGVHGVQTLDDGCRLIDSLTTGDPKRAVVVGAGYIGIEMAEACVQRGLETTVIDKAPEPMGTLDPDLGRQVHDAMEGMDIDVVTDTGIESFEVGYDRVTGVVTGGRTYAADVVIFGLGVRPRTQLAATAGLPLGAYGGVRVEPSMAVPGLPGVWAAGDCVEVWDRLREEFAYIPLGTHANKQGRIAGLNLSGGHAVFQGVVGTAVTKVCDLEVARTGLTQTQADAAGHKAVSATIETTTRAGYFPGAQPMTVRLTAEPHSGRLLGAQIIGKEGSAIRIDTCATALWTRMCAQDLVDLDLAYAPPFSSTWDPIQVAARSLLDRLR